MNIPHYADARRTWEPTPLDELLKRTLRPIQPERASASAERAFIERKIAAKQAELARLAGEIRWLKLELEGL